MASFAAVKVALENGEINGYCDPRFSRVAEEFNRNFKERGEVGGSVCITLEGETVVDLWGGVARPTTNTPWEENTISIIWSCTKGATALCAHILASRGLLDFDAPVAKYWPEFAQAGKENIPVRMLLNHQSGLAGLRNPLPEGAFTDWEVMTQALAAAEPLWKPGLMRGYQGITFGWLVGEVVRRISGKSLGTFFREEVAEPLGLDFWIGLPEEHEGRTATMMMPANDPDPSGVVSPFFAALADPTSPSALMFFNNGGYVAPRADGVMWFDSREGHAAEVGAAGGISNARGLAGMYAPLANGGSHKGVRLVDAESLYKMSAVSSAGVDAVLLLPLRFSLGYMKTVDNRHVPGAVAGDNALLSEAAFGHCGFGGSVGFADPEAKMSFGYTMNKMGPGTGLNERGQSLVDAAYLSLGYTSNAAGAWLK
jgi:CubicO group peptidase (beta-lactamase class C family)